jgi:hypothetical protein
VANKFVAHADKIYELQPSSAARLYAVGAQGITMFGGCARGYAAPAPNIEIQYYDENGQRVEPPEPVENLSLDEILELAARHEARHVQVLPCNDWSANDPDASPVVEEPDPSLPSPDYREPEKNPDIIPGKPVPSRAKFIPTNQG